MSHRFIPRRFKMLFADLSIAKSAGLIEYFEVRRDFIGPCVQISLGTKLQSHQARNKFADTLYWQHKPIIQSISHPITKDHLFCVYLKHEN